MKKSILVCLFTLLTVTAAIISSCKTEKLQLAKLRAELKLGSQETAASPSSGSEVAPGTHATVTTHILHNGNAPIIEKGICYLWADVANTAYLEPTVSHKKIVDNTAANTPTFTTTLTPTKNNSLCNIRAYAISSAGISYSNPLSFKTKDKAGSDFNRLQEQVNSNTDRIEANKNRIDSAFKRISKADVEIIAINNAFNNYKTTNDSAIQKLNEAHVSLKNLVENNHKVFTDFQNNEFKNLAIAINGDGNKTGLIKKVEDAQEAFDQYKNTADELKGKVDRLANSVGYTEGKDGKGTSTIATNINRIENDLKDYKNNLDELNDLLLGPITGENKRDASKGLVKKQQATQDELNRLNNLFQAVSQRLLNPEGNNDAISPENYVTKIDAFKKSQENFKTYTKSIISFLANEAKAAHDIIMHDSGTMIRFGLENLYSNVTNSAKEVDNYYNKLKSDEKDITILYQNLTSLKNNLEILRNNFKILKDKYISIIKEQLSSQLSPLAEKVDKIVVKPKKYDNDSRGGKLITLFHNANDPLYHGMFDEIGSVPFYLEELRKYLKEIEAGMTAIDNDQTITDKAEAKKAYLKAKAEE